MKEMIPNKRFALPALPGSAGGSTNTNNTGGSAGGGGGASSSGTTTASGQGTAVPAFGQFLQQMLAAYEPAQVGYATQDAQALAGEIASWLRPAYDAAIGQRERQTQTQNANLDADAIARGMGTSSYVTDVKSRNYQLEADDVRLMESDYSAKLSLYLYNAMDADRARALEADTFNASETNKARARAYDAAFALYQQALAPEAISGKGGGKSKSGASTSASAVVASILAAGGTQTNVSAATGLEYLASLTAAQQNQLFNGSSTATAAARNEVVKAIGASSFAQLQSLFNAK